MYPPLYPFISVKRWRSYRKHALTWNDVSLAVAEKHLAFQILPLVTGTELANYLGISKKLVSAMSRHPNKYYREFQITKRSGGMRTITAPRVFLKTVQRYILDCVLSPILPHDAAHGFVRDRSPFTGAIRHIGSKFVWNIDLKDFFPSISKSRVKVLYESIGYPHQAATILSELCCLDDRLPQGAPTSPAIANLLFKTVDAQLSKQVEQEGITYTRYADDLTFSSMRPITESFQTFVNDLLRISGFVVNERKSRLMGPRCRREVTGLSVSTRVSIPRSKRRNLRARFHQVSKAPERFVHEKQKLLGYAAWVLNYHPDEGARYLAIARTIPN